MGIPESFILRIISESPAKVSFKALKDTLRKSHRMSTKELKHSLAKLVASGTVCYTSHYGRSFIELSYGQPQSISDHIVIKPPRLSFATAKGQLSITLERGASFGGGEHPTTRMAVQLIDALLHRPPWWEKKETLQALDIGTGSGVLAIVAAKIGVGRVYGIDNDPCSIHEARNNVGNNKLADRIDISDTELNNHARSYEMIFANIRTPTLIAMCETIDEKAKPECVLVLSGMREEETPSVCDKYRTVGFEGVEKREEKGWAAVCLARGLCLREARGCAANH
jgi:ribosomal protein L11 methyltransferase